MVDNDFPSLLFQVLESLIMDQDLCNEYVEYLDGAEATSLG